MIYRFIVIKKQFPVQDQWQFEILYYKKVKCLFYETNMIILTVKAGSSLLQRPVVVGSLSKYPPV